MKKINLKTIRKKILNIAIKYAPINGWNYKLITLISNKSKFTEKEINALFPEGYKSILRFYLLESNVEFTKASKKLSLIRMKTSERIKQLILLKIKINAQNKLLIKKIFFTLLLPNHSKLASLSLFKTVDQIWFLAGDNSTDFNYYTKRATLALIYSSTVFFWINNNYNYYKTEKFLDQQLLKIYKISKIKSKLNYFKESVPNIFSILKNFNFIKQ